MAGPAWNSLTPQEKDRYKEGAKNAEPIINQNRKKYNCIGKKNELFYYAEIIYQTVVKVKEF